MADQSWMVSAWAGRRGRCVRLAPGGCGGCSACSQRGGSHGMRTAPSQLSLGQPEETREEGGRGDGRTREGVREEGGRKERKEKGGGV